MDVKQAIRELQKLERWRTNAIANGDASEERRCDGMIGRIQDACESWADMAEAAMAYMEYQATSVHDPDECDLDRAQQRAKLWDAFLEARAKTKATGQQ